MVYALQLTLKFAVAHKLLKKCQDYILSIVKDNVFESLIKMSCRNARSCTETTRPLAAKDVACEGSRERTEITS